GASLPKPAAGQYLTVRVNDAGDPAPVRSYSLSSGPDTGTYRISVKREPHGVASSWLHTNLRTGSVLEIAAPRGEFVLTDDDGPILLISAGIGITPVLAMLHVLAAARSTRTVWWIHVTRSAGQEAFATEAAGLLDALPNARRCTFYTAPDADI